MKRAITTSIALATLMIIVGTVRGDGPPAKPLGTWERKADDNAIKLEFKADGLRINLNAGENKITVDADYGVTKDGVIYGIATKIKKEGTDEGPEQGQLFSFRFVVNGDTLTLSDLKGTDSDEAKQMFQGDYKKVAGK